MTRSESSEPFEMSGYNRSLSADVLGMIYPDKIALSNSAATVDNPVLALCAGFVGESLQYIGRYRLPGTSQWSEIKSSFFERPMV